MKQRIGLVVFSVLVVVLLAVAGVGCFPREETPPAPGPERVRERIGIDARDDSYFYNGADVIWYNDDHGTVVAKIDGDGTGLVSAPTAVGTATPAFFVDSAGVSNVFEVRDAGTPVWYVSNGGGVTQSGGSSLSNNLVVAAPTAIGTATPAALIKNAGVSKLLDVQDGTTSQVEAFNGGGVKITAPTAVATAVPALYVDSTGVSNVFEVRDAATPVFAVRNGGTFEGVLKYGTAGETVVNGTSSITTTATASHGLTTVTWAMCTMGEDPGTGAGDAAVCTVAVSGNVVTLKTWQDDFSAATETSVDIHWLVIGTP